MSNRPSHNYHRYYPDHSRPPATTFRHPHAPYDLRNPTYPAYLTHSHLAPQSQPLTTTDANDGFSYPYNHHSHSTAYSYSSSSPSQTLPNNPLISPGNRLTTSNDGYIQRLRDEVLYLHGLWRQRRPITPPNPIHSSDPQILNGHWHRGHGIPPSNPTPSTDPQILSGHWHREPLIPAPVPNLSPNPQIHHRNWQRGPPLPVPAPVFSPNPQTIRPLKSFQTTIFKKKKKKTTTTKNQSKPPRTSDKEWPVGPQPPDPPADWCTWPETQPSSATVRMATEEEKASINAMRVQKRGLDSFRALLGGGNSGSSSSPELDSETESEEEDEDDDQERLECFAKVFQEDGELRSYYEKNWEHGVFCCLVCRGIGYKVGKKYKNLVALVQHTVSVSKTKRTRAHRTYGQVICKILGWDVNQLPSVSDNPNSEPVHETGDAAHVGTTSIRADNTDSETTLSACAPQDLNCSELRQDESSRHACEAATIEDGDNRKTADINADKDISTAALEILNSAKTESDQSQIPKSTPEIAEDSADGNDQMPGNDHAPTSVEGDGAGSSTDPLGQGY